MSETSATSWNRTIIRTTSAIRLQSSGISEDREIPIETIGPPAQDADRFLDVVADFHWKHRYLASRDL